MSALCRFCCKSRRRGWRGSAKPFLKEVPCIPIPACSGRSGGGDARRLEIAHSTSTLWSLQHSRNGGGWHDRRRPGDQLYEPAEILCDRCQRELELGPARPAQSQAAEPQDALEMCKQHLNAFSVMARSLECFRLGQRASNVTSFLVDAAWHPAERRLWTAMRLQWAATAVTHAGHIQECLAIVDQPARRREGLAGRADV